MQVLIEKSIQQDEEAQQTMTPHHGAQEYFPAISMSSFLTPETKNDIYITHEKNIQSIIVGVKNIYLSDAYFISGIHIPSVDLYVPKLSQL